ncbi:hypothetical protein BDV95DRAFT_610941 [Massariosphaeria phaeospora]|uniref:Uncharacterized protein n=1 Tax=Massariosphaeria phaeospora TaxID=100035 RepID=A0A7C8I072_9PLEO|nr:hypothetical protein BDV95DRAFT_610941 [Massariosphaeria phaeospora]
MDSSAREQLLQILADVFALQISPTHFAALLKDGLTITEAVERLNLEQDNSEDETSSEEESDDDGSDEEETNTAKADPARLPLLLELFEYCKKEPSVLTRIAKDTSLTSIRDVALNAFPQYTVETDELRAHLYITEPTAVIAGLLDADRINLPNEASGVIGAAVKDLLDHDFDILRMPVAPACEQWLGKEDRTTSEATLCEIQRLAVIVRQPEDIGALLRANFTSANAMAQTALPSFEQQMELHGPLLAEPVKIYSHAVTIDQHNDQITTLMSQQFGTIDVHGLAPAMAGPAPGGEAAAAEEAVDEETNRPYDTSEVYMTMQMPQTAEKAAAAVPQRTTRVMGQKPTLPAHDDVEKKLTDTLKESTTAASSILLDMNLPENPDALSVLSPAAYLVDLLRMLKGVHEDPIAAAGTATQVQATSTDSSKQQTATGGDLLTRLLHRRPDIEHLQLSVLNQEVRMPYIDIANEIMESVVSYFGGPSSKTIIESHNMGDVDTEELSLREPQHVDYTVYEEYIHDQVAPLHEFPYNFSLERTRNLMNGFRLSRLGLLQAFCTEDVLVHALDINANVAQSVAQTIVAAEQLHMSLDDFCIITGQDFYGKPSGKTYTPHKLWGFKTEDDMLDVSPKQVGLYFVEKQLLPRAGISFETLVQIVHCPFFNENLHIYPHKPGNNTEDSPMLAASLEDYRICNTDSETLTSTSCHRLNVFLRLLIKLKWPVHELSEALIALGATTELSTIPASVLVGLAALEDLSHSSEISILSLLLLWTKSTNSQFQSLLKTELELARMSGLDSVFANGVVQGQWPDHESLIPHALIVGACLDLDAEDVELLIASKKIADLVNWETLGIVRKVALLCKILKISVADYLSLSSESSLGIDDLFESPGKTLAFSRRWRKLLGTDSTDSLLQCFESREDEDSSSQTERFLGSTITYFTSNKLWADRLVQSDKTVQDRAKASIDKAISSLLSEAVPALTVPASIHFSETVEVIGKGVLDGIQQSPSIRAPTSGLLFTPSTSRCIFVIEGVQEAGKGAVQFNGEGLVFEKRTVDKNVTFESKSIQLQTDSFYKLTVGLQQGILSMRHDGEGPSFIPQETISTVTKGLHHLSITAAVIKMMKLEKSEIAQLIPQEYGSYASRLSLLEEFTCYKDFQSRTRQLLTFPTTISSLDETTKLSVPLQQLTNWPAKFVDDILDANYPGVSETERKSVFRNFGSVSKLYAQADLMAKSNLFRAAPQTFVDCAIGELNGKLYEASDKLSSTVRSLTLSSGPSQIAFQKSNELLRISRRDALIQYLLQQDYIKVAKIKDADDLFEYFLIDVQMGADQQTTRIMQAIAAVQLFVERCFMNMESGVSPSALDKPQWTSWLGNYRQWEANRKIFLYPENWVDPTLRDNKTEVFKELETAIAQKQLDKNTMLQLVKNYIYGVHDLGSLQVESYYQEVRKGNEHRFHIFARTKSSPPRYYYRTMDYTAQITIVPEWTPWQIIQVDVPMYEVDDIGNTLDHPGSYLVPFVWKQQLHLLMPQLVLKPGETGKDKPASALAVLPSASKEQQAPSGTKSWGRYWELKLAWTIYRDGAWTPKCTSLSTLKIEILENDADKFPDVSSLVFRVDAQPLGLSIYIERTLQKSKSEKKEAGPVIVTLGKFVMRGDSLVNQPQESVTTTTIVSATVFNKLIQPSKTWAQDDGKNPWAGATFALPPFQYPSTGWDTKWTLNYAGQSNTMPQGLIVAIESAKAGATFTWFRIPHDTISEKGSNASVKLYNVLDSRLIEAATNAVSLKDIFDAITVFDNEMNLEETGLDLVEAKSLSEEEKKKAIKAKQEYSSWDKLNNMNSVYGKHGSTYYKETSTPYAIYNWELGFHVVALLMERLAATRQYDLALEVARLVFDPTIVSQKEKHAQWSFLPFRDEKTRAQGKTYTLLSELPRSSVTLEGVHQIILDWRRNSFSPHAIARNRPLAYMKRLALKYVQVLVDAGDAEFRKDTLESMPIALQLYVEASHVFGPAPQKIPAVTKTNPLTYKDIAEKLDEFGNASVELEVVRPFFVPFDERGRAVAASASGLGFVKAPYFTIPPNPEISALRARIDDRLFKVRNYLDLNGQPRRATMFGPPLDPKNLINRGAGERVLDQVVADVNVSLSKYRFKFLLQKSLDLCAELKSLGLAYLSAKERKDSEQMMTTKMNQERVVNNIVLQMKTVQKEEATATLEQLRQSRESAAFRLQYYSALTGDAAQIPGEEQGFDPVQQSIGRRSPGYLRMSAEEETELKKAATAAEWTLLANGMEFSASILAAIPPISTQAQPWGVGVTVSSPPWGQGALIAASIFKGLSQIEAEQGMNAGRVNRLRQQLSERRQQLNQAGFDIKSTDLSIKAQKARIATVDKDVEVQRQQMKNALETVDYLKTKFNNVDLYSYLDHQTMMVFSHTYNLAFELARHARKAFCFETGQPDTPLVSGDYWDDARGGLLCAENLSMSLRNMELQYLDKAVHTFEIVKHVSLRQVAPLSLLKLRSQGETHFSLPEVLFDADFPGHLFRKIKSVSVSILCTIGPYTSLNCLLSLESSSYRTLATTNGQYISQGVADPRFVHVDTASKHIAVSSGQQDTGVFQLDFNDDKYMPFEGAGTISSWKVHFPSFALNKIDFSSISDVIMHLRYTSRDGGEALKTAAQNSVKEFLQTIQALDKDGSFGLLDLKHDYPMEWHRLVTGSFSGDTVRLQLQNVKERLPFYTKAHPMRISNVHMLFKTAADITENIGATINETVFVKNDAPSVVPADFYCLSVGNKALVADDQDKSRVGSAAVPKSKDTGSWPQDNWVVDLKCSSGVARQFKEGFLVFSYSLAIPTQNAR